MFVRGGLASDNGMLAELRDTLDKKTDVARLEVVTHESAIFAGSIGAALWGAYRYRKLSQHGVAWTSKSKVA